MPDMVPGNQASKECPPARHRPIVGNRYLGALDVLAHRTMLAARILQQESEDQSGHVPWSQHGSVRDRKSTRLNSSHLGISYAGFCLEKKTNSDCATTRRAN